MAAVNEGRVIRLKLMAYGYEKGRVPMEYTPNLEPIRYALQKLPENTTVVGFTSKTEDVVRNSREFLERHFNLHDVPYLSFTSYKSILEEGATDTISYMTNVRSRIREESELINPFELPIAYTDGHSMDGELLKNLPVFDDEAHVRDCPVTFSGVQLGNNVTQLSSATHAHEIVHGQLESIKGSCKNYYNREVLSIFVEKLYAYEADPSGELLKKSEQMRSRYLGEMLALLKAGPSRVSRTSLVEVTVAVQSTFKANHLFDMYISGDVDTQTSILDGIQKVFDGESTVEELLDSKGITYENSANLVLTKRRS